MPEVHFEFTQERPGDIAIGDWILWASDPDGPPQMARVQVALFEHNEWRFSTTLGMLVVQADEFVNRIA